MQEDIKVSVMATEIPETVNECSDLSDSQKLTLLLDEFILLGRKVDMILGIMEEGKRAVEGMSTNPMARMMLKNLGIG